MYISVESLVGFLAVILTIIGAVAFISSKASKIETKVDILGESIQEVKHTLLAFDTKISVLPMLTDRVDTLWASQFSIQKSPLQLNELGTNILNESNVVDTFKDLREEVKTKLAQSKAENAYQAQEKLTQILNDYSSDLRVKEKLELAAFNTGRDVYTLIYVLSLFWRDGILVELGLNPKDIDIQKRALI